MNDLTLIPTDALLDQLFSRFDHAAFVALATTVEHSDGTGEHFVQRRWDGNTHVVIGLLSDIQYAVLCDLHARHKPVTDNDTP